ncbi:hypothetical protein FOL46_004268 [Perkinsus olseni]|uniref:Uncharacterized protein n=1 Tax=Perkinsus olseni TaxID=32597 RepID=A0A7J6LYP0_PEROL|nr:hypothetical protein FOL46_004268 [Perkinsus olseni]
MGIMQVGWRRGMTEPCRGYSSNDEPYQGIWQVRLQDSLMTKTQENLLLRGKLGIAQLELDRKEEITRQCIEEMRRLHAENNRLLSVVQANGLDIGIAIINLAGGKHHQSTAAVAPISSPATTAASGEDCCAIPPSKPMSAEEEYFRMVVLAVKLNSTYLDNLGLFDPRDLYRRACEEKVPFHQWHKWVESQMIRGVYRPLAGSAPTSPQPPPQPPTAEGNDSIGPTLEGKRSVIRDEYLHGGAPNSSSSSSSFFGNRLQLPERVNGIFSSISRRVGRQSNHDTPKCHQRGGAPARRRAASLEITPRRGHQARSAASSIRVDDIDPTMLQNSDMLAYLTFPRYRQAYRACTVDRRAGVQQISLGKASEPILDESWMVIEEPAAQEENNAAADDDDDDDDDDDEDLNTAIVVARLARLTREALTLATPPSASSINTALGGILKSDGGGSLFTSGWHHSLFGLLDQLGSLRYILTGSRVPWSPLMRPYAHDGDSTVLIDDRNGTKEDSVKAIVGAILDAGEGCESVIDRIGVALGYLKDPSNSLHYASLAERLMPRISALLERAACDYGRLTLEHSEVIRQLAYLPSPLSKMDTSSPTFHTPLIIPYTVRKRLCGNISLLHYGPHRENSVRIIALDGWLVEGSVEAESIVDKLHIPATTVSAFIEVLLLDNPSAAASTDLHVSKTEWMCRLHGMGPSIQATTVALLEGRAVLIRCPLPSSMGHAIDEMYSKNSIPASSHATGLELIPMPWSHHITEVTTSGEYTSEWKIGPIPLCSGGIDTPKTTPPGEGQSDNRVDRTFTTISKPYPLSLCAVHLLSLNSTIHFGGLTGWIVYHLMLGVEKISIYSDTPLEVAPGVDEFVSDQSVEWHHLNISSEGIDIAMTACAWSMRGVADKVAFLQVGVDYLTNERGSIRSIARDLLPRIPRELSVMELPRYGYSSRTVSSRYPLENEYNPSSRLRMDSRFGSVIASPTVVIYVRTVCTTTPSIQGLCSFHVNSRPGTLYIDDVPGDVVRLNAYCHHTGQGDYHNSGDFLTDWASAKKAEFTDRLPEFREQLATYREEMVRVEAETRESTTESSSFQEGGGLKVSGNAKASMSNHQSGSTMDVEVEL